MLSAIRSSARPQQSSLFSYSLPNHIARKPPFAIRFAQAASGPKQPDDPSNEMDSEKQRDYPESETRDTMSCFGEGYATRSDEEGFGGIYRGNQYVRKDGKEKTVHGDDAEFDHNQGSEVKEKEIARHQQRVAN